MRRGTSPVPAASSKASRSTSPNDLCGRIKVKCEIVAQDWDGIIPALNAKKYDAIMAGMNITDKRLEVLGFSRPYAATPHGLGVMKDRRSPSCPGPARSCSLDKDPDGAQEGDRGLEAVPEGQDGRSAGLDRQLRIPREVPQGHDRRSANTRPPSSTTSICRRAGSTRSSQRTEPRCNAIDKPEFNGMMIAGAGMRGDVLGRGVAVAVRKDDTELKSDVRCGHQGRHRGRHDREIDPEMVQDRHDAAGLITGSSSPARNAPGMTTARA